VLPSLVALISSTIDNNRTPNPSVSPYATLFRSTHTVLIDWGTGEGTTTLDLPAGVLSFSASHQYLDDNPTGTSSDDFHVSATVTDDDTGSGTDASTITVYSVAPSNVVLNSATIA